MGRPEQFLLAFVTAPNLKTARLLARAALEPKLAACVNIIPKLESHYWWQGKLEKASEILLVIKTTRSHVKKLQAAILKAHPYDTAEFIALPIKSGSQKYLDWIARSVG